MSDYLKELSLEFSENVKLNYDLKKKNWFNIGGKAKAFFKPENTIPSFQWCVENNISWAECDVQLTKDDIPIIFHDESLFKVSNKKNIVC